MATVKHTRESEVIAMDIRSAILKALQRTEAFYTDTTANQIGNLITNCGNEENIITDVQDTINSYLESELQPFLDEYQKAQQEVANDAKDTVEQAYRQAQGM